LGEGERKQKDLEARARSAAAFAAIFTLVAGGKLAGLTPSYVAVVASGLALAGLIAAWRFTVGARDAGLELAEQEVEREHTELVGRAPVAAVGQIDPTQIGVDAAAQTILDGGRVPRYAGRAVDGELRGAVKAALEGSGPWIVVVMGPSKVGKSRALFEALRHCAQDRELALVAPVDGDALRALLSSGRLRPQHSRVVLWLDDLEPFLNADVRLATLRRWHAGGAGWIVAATYGGKGSELIAGSAAGGLATIAAEVLADACEIPMEATTASELSALRSATSREQFEGVERHGLAAYLVAAPALERKLYTQRHAPGEDPCPEGLAVVHAAVDWARCGRTDPIPEQTLRRLWRSYLPVGVDPTDEGFAGALAWALRPVAGTIALVQRTGSYQAFDYVVRLVRDRPGVEPPREASWLAATETASDAQALAVGTSAYGHSRLDHARRALVRARESTLDEVAAIAGFNLGVVLGELDRSEEAIGVYDDVVARFGEAPEPALREIATQVLRAQEDADAND
jgi:hypothetical protein